MTDSILNRRSFLMSAVAGAAGLSLGGLANGKDLPPPVKPDRGPLPVMAVRQVQTDTLDIGYHETGPENGRPVILLHGFPYDLHSSVDVAPMLAAQGFRVIVPHLRGHGTTRFLDAATPRSGQQAAIGQDLLDLMDALHIPEAVLAGYDWGGRAACVVAALRPSRVVGLVSVNSYLIQDIAKAANPAPAKVEAGFWYQFYFLTERGRAGLTANRDDIARIMWEGNSPTWRFDGPTFAHAPGKSPGLPDDNNEEGILATGPGIKGPAITMDGIDDGVIRATDGSASAAKFSGPRSHRQIPGVGHNLPQEAPKAFADAVAELARNGKWRT